MVRRKREKPYRMRARKGDPRRKRHFIRVYNALRDKGLSHKDAERIAAAKVNQYRAAHGELVSDVGRSRAWYPGKKPKSHKGRKVA